jgi:hypothetical protein
VRDVALREEVKHSSTGAFQASRWWEQGGGKKNKKNKTPDGRESVSQIDGSDKSPSLKLKKLTLKSRFSI